jgi:hypothetical protein
MITSSQNSCVNPAYVLFFSHFYPASLLYSVTDQSGLTDINGQQLDLRMQNSWLLKMDEVSTPEIMECMFVNAIAPFVLNSRLKPLMEAFAGDLTRSVHHKCIGDGG